MKKVFITLALSISVLTASAQEQAIKQYGFWDNWYIQLQGGASYFLGENSRRADFGDMISPHAALSVGKHFSPIFGARLQAAGWESKIPYDYNNLNTYGTKYVQGNLDGLVNLTNLFTTFKGEKFFNLYLLGGVTYMHRFNNDNIGTAHIIAPRGGLQADFRLSEKFSLNLEANANLLPDRFDGVVSGEPNDVPINALLGITYRLSGKGFELADGPDLAQVRSLNDDINGLNEKLRQRDTQITNLKAELAKKPATVVEKVATTDKEVLLNAVVVFKIGSSKLEQNQEINIYNAAKYLQENPSVNVLVTGYADRATGNEKINQSLSEQRAKAVADILTKKYGIDAKRISTAANGDKNQPFEINEWNRVVVFTAK